MSAYTGQLVESRLDYLTLTASKPADRDLLEMRARQILRDESARGADGRLWHWYGYSGASTRDVAYGQRPDGDILRLSGSIADDVFDTTYPLASHVSRIDLAVTVRCDGDTDERITQEWSNVRSFRSSQGHTPFYDFRQTSKGGNTLYIGKRTSRHFARVYNKHSQSELDYYAGCIRYEVEAKGSLAPALARAIAGSANRGLSCRHYVHDFLTKRGITPAFDTEPDELRIAPYRRRSDSTSRLAWFAAQGRPALAALRAAGLEQEAYTALGVE